MKKFKLTNYAFSMAKELDKAMRAFEEIIVDTRAHKSLTKEQAGAIDTYLAAVVPYEPNPSRRMIAYGHAFMMVVRGCLDGHSESSIDRASEKVFNHMEQSIMSEEVKKFTRQHNQTHPTRHFPI